MTSALRGKIQQALADSGGSEAASFREAGVDARLLQRALQALDDPAALSAMGARLIRWVAIHELCHACDLGHHAPDTAGGELTCPIRNPSAEDKLYGIPRELTLQQSRPLPFGITALCQQTDNCWSRLRLKAK